MQETSSIYSDHYGHTQEVQAANAVATAVPRLPIAVRESPSPKFDVQVRVKKSPPPPPSPSLSSSDAESVATLRNERNNLSTIMETHEDRESVVTMDSLPVREETVHTQFTYAPEIHPTPQHLEIVPAPAPQPVFSIYTRTHHEVVDGQPETWSDYTTDGPAHSEITDMTSEAPDIHSVSEMVDTTHYVESTYLPPEPPIVVKKPQVTSHTVDDVYLRTITEKKTIEDIESHKRRVTEYKAKPKPLPPPKPDPTWDVKIRNYPTEGEQQQWENFSDISSVSNMTLTPQMQRSELNIPAPVQPLIPTEPPQQIHDNKQKLTSPELVGNMKPIEIPPEDKAVPNWDVLIRILEEPELHTTEIADDTSSVHSSVHHHTPLTQYISYDDKAKWKEIITTESSLRTMLTEAVVREDFERIRQDTRYERIFEPQTWDVIIRILAPPPSDDDDVDMRQAPKPKKQPWDTRSRRSSLPTLYEYDSDGGSSVRTIRIDPTMPLHVPSGTGFNLQRSRRSSRTSYHTDHNDFRSMSEVTVDFGRPEHLDNLSNVSSYYPVQYYEDDDRRSFHRSVSHPSLARSASEFTEQWIAPEELSSPEGTPKPRRLQQRLVS